MISITRINGEDPNLQIMVNKPQGITKQSSKFDAKETGARVGYGLDESRA